jgi:hypothetical protein
MTQAIQIGQQFASAPACETAARHGAATGGAALASNADIDWRLQPDAMIMPFKHRMMLL